jgi:hypothetical protein
MLATPAGRRCRVRPMAMYERADGGGVLYIRYLGMYAGAILSSNFTHCLLQTRVSLIENDMLARRSNAFEFLNNKMQYFGNNDAYLVLTVDEPVDYLNVNVRKALFSLDDWVMV